MDDEKLVSCSECEYAEKHENDYWICKKQNIGYTSWGVDWVYSRQKCKDFKKREW